jgi:hypothetical protein
MNVQDAGKLDEQCAVSPSLRWRLVLLVRGFEPLEAQALIELRARVEDGMLGGFEDGEPSAERHVAQAGR